MGVKRVAYYLRLLYNVFLMLWQELRLEIQKW